MKRKNKPKKKWIMLKNKTKREEDLHSMELSDRLYL